MAGFEFSSSSQSFFHYTFLIPLRSHEKIVNLTPWKLCLLKTLTLSLRYGYRGKDCRANVYLLPTGEIVYFIASVVVLFNYEERTQRHYLGHTDCVKWLVSFNICSFFDFILSFFFIWVLLEVISCGVLRT